MRAIVLAASAALVCPASAAPAANYPVRPITLTIGFAPGGPSDVMARILTKKLHRTAAGALNDAEVRKAPTDLGVDVVATTPEQLRAHIKAEIPKWAAIVKASGAKVD